MHSSLLQLGYWLFPQSLMLKIWSPASSSTRRQCSHQEVGPGGRELGYREQAAAEDIGPWLFLFSPWLQASVR